MSDATPNSPNREAFIADMISLARGLIPTIRDDYRIEGQDDDTPTLQVTVGCECPSADAMLWSYQTGHTSFYGNAYSFPHWGIGCLTRDTSPADFADEIVRSLEENEDFTFAPDGETPTYDPPLGARPDPDPHCEHCDGEGTETHMGVSGYYDGHCTHCWVHDANEPHCDTHKRFEYDCIDCSDARYQRPRL